MGARVLALEAFMIVCVEAIVDQPNVKAKDAQAMLARMAKSAKETLKDTKHPEVITQGEMYVDELTDRLADALPKMRDGKPG